ITGRAFIQADADQRLRRRARADLRESAPVAAVTAEARVVVEQRAELRNFPDEIERTAARLPAEALIVVEVLRRMAKRLARAIVDGGIAALAVLARCVVTAR